MKRVLTCCTVRSPKIREPLRLAVAPDLHSAGWEDVLPEILKCDALLLPGDLVDRHRKNNELAKRFLREVPELLPVFYSVGNHELLFHPAEEWRAWVRDSRAVLLDNASVPFRGILLGGLSSSRDSRADAAFLDRFEAEEGYRLLLCHHPEMYRDWVRSRDIDLTLCGHAHGGQIQILGRGLYAPGQGLLPKLTHGWHDGGKMLISRGMTNNAFPPAPRIHNPCEMIILTLEPEEEGGNAHDA